MNIKKHKNLIIQGKHNKPILLDCLLPQKSTKTAIYCHGFKGFKDWGANDKMAHYFAENGINFIKFNFSHNGGTPEQPIDFPDLEAFGNNNFSKELDDLEVVLNWIENNVKTPQEITLLGHSRGSGTAIIKASEDARIKKIISLAGVSNFKARFIDEATLKYWKEKGVIYVDNTRTQQQMPLYYQIVEDIEQNEQRLHIEHAAKRLNKPHLIIHGNQDPTVALEEAKAVHRWSSQSILKVIDQADHVFNVKHPWQNKPLPSHFLQMKKACLDFIKNN